MISYTVSLVNPVNARVQIDNVYNTHTLPRERIHACRVFKLYIDFLSMDPGTKGRKRDLLSCRIQSKVFLAGKSFVFTCMLAGHGRRSPETHARAQKESASSRTPSSPSEPCQGNVPFLQVDSNYPNPLRLTLRNH